MSELKACPFCEQPIEVKYDGELFDFYISCGSGGKKSCRIFVCADTEDEVIEAWNNRPIEDKLRKELETAKEIIETKHNDLIKTEIEWDKSIEQIHDLQKELEKVKEERDKWKEAYDEDIRRRV
jgi:hypothetical protein